MASSITATGVHSIPNSNGSLPLRREIRDLQANFKDQWNLFLLGLADLQRKDVSDLLSYYQLAGIHGQPYVPWDDVQGDANARFGGYCTHSSILFLTWHRPYLALYEQALYASVQDVANSYQEPLRTRYIAAAKDFRMPYWDWAIKITGQASAYPAPISSSSATVVDIDGATKQIPNPLYSFRFDDKEIPSEFALDDSWSQIPNTIRAPDSSNNSQDALVSRVITNEAASLRNNVSLILLSYKQFDAFSNNAWLQSGTPGHYGSLEDLHNEIHDKVGEGGHMGALDVSAFDPVFWLHHTNVDRLWAIWQALNPNSFAIDKIAQAQEANFTVAAGTEVTANTDLKPFYDASGINFWNSTGVKSTTPFGFAYPETQAWLYPSTQAYQAAVQSKVVDLYGGNVINNFFADLLVPASVPAPVSAPVSASVAGDHAADGHVSTKDFVKKAIAHPLHAAQEFLHKEHAAHHHHDEATEPVSSTKAGVNGAPPTQAQEATNGNHVKIAGSNGPSHEPEPAPKHDQAETPNGHTAANPEPATGPVPLNVPEQFAHLVPNRTYTEWITNLRTIKHALNQTFRVYVFLGDFNPDPTTWPTEHNVVGRFTVLGRGRETTACSKCQQDADDELVVTGTVPLTSALLQDIVAGRLASLQPGDVDEYLKKNLHWRVTLFDGSEKPRDQVPGLKVSVVSTVVRIGDDGIPIYSGHYDSHPEITDGRPAGLGAGDAV